MSQQRLALESVFDGNAGQEYRTGISDRNIWEVGLKWIERKERTA